MVSVLIKQKGVILPCSHGRGQASGKVAGLEPGILSRVEAVPGEIRKMKWKTSGDLPSQPWLHVEPSQQWHFNSAQIDPSWSPCYPGLPAPQPSWCLFSTAASWKEIFWKYFVDDSKISKWSQVVNCRVFGSSCLVAASVFWMKSCLRASCLNRFANIPLVCAMPFPMITW